MQVRDSLPGYSPQTGLAANLSQVGRQSAPPPPLPFPGQQVMTMQPASSALQHSASSPVSNDLGAFCSMLPPRFFWRFCHQAHDNLLVHQQGR